MQILRGIVSGSMLQQVPKGKMRPEAYELPQERHCLGHEAASLMPGIHDNHQNGVQPDELHASLHVTQETDVSIRCRPGGSCSSGGTCVGWSSFARSGVRSRSGSIHSCGFRPPARAEGVQQEASGDVRARQTPQHCRKAVVLGAEACLMLSTCIASGSLAAHVVSHCSDVPDTVYSDIDQKGLTTKQLLRLPNAQVHGAGIMGTGMSSPCLKKAAQAAGTACSCWKARATFFALRAHGHFCPP